MHEQREDHSWLVKHTGQRATPLGVPLAFAQDRDDVEARGRGEADDGTANARPCQGHVNQDQGNGMTPAQWSRHGGWRSLP